MKIQRFLLCALVTIFVFPFFVHAAPVLESYDPADDVTNRPIDSLSVTACFDQNITRGMGNITLHDSSNDSIVYTWDVADSEVVGIEGTCSVLSASFDPALPFSTVFYFNFDPGTFIGEDEEPFLGIADDTTWNFTTRPPLGTPLYSFERISLSNNEEEGVVDSMSITPFSLSGDGRYVAFFTQDETVAGQSVTFGATLLRDREEGATNFIANESSGPPTISRDGRYVVFDSQADDLVAGDDNTQPDIFIYDVVGEGIERVETLSGEDLNQGAYEATVSPDGRFIVFESTSDNIVEGDTNGSQDVFLYDRDLEIFERINVTSDEEETTTNSGVGGSYHSVSDDGRYVLFLWSTNAELTEDLVEGDDALYLRDRQDGTTVLVADNVNTPGAFSSDGRYVVFSSQSEGLTEDEVSGDGAVFLKDMQEDSVLFIADYAYVASITPDGRFVAYVSCVGGGGDYPCHLYRFDTETEGVLLVTDGADNLSGSDVTKVSMSLDGSMLDFMTNAVNLVEDDTNNISDIFLWDENAQPDNENPGDGGDENSNGDSGSNKSSHRRSGASSVNVVQGVFSNDVELLGLQRKLIELLKELLFLLSE